ncbi:MAG: carbohydrate ABC transporter permease, partial [Clostridiales bacterium]|nr:carbohydrate ABC transporter permease [Clostridiales bacterium]
MTTASSQNKNDAFHGVNKVRISDFVIAFFILMLSLTCILPFIHVMAKSISSNTEVMSKNVFLWPKGVNMDAYVSIFKDGQLTHSMVYTIVVTLLFTVIGMVITTFAAFPLSIRSFKGRSFFSLMIMFTMYFSAGLIPEYLLLKNLGLTNTMWVLVLPLCFSPYNLLIMKS